eukprot:TRINITY_DN1286_c0_g1_i12.p4 TRINITY_DN1286_c0_g1~~TRINITY_DN1286_c0_g1_i12.p4  ORF type:complete len:126 (-),score=37.01 TRINITY_DN1286_c0_g1_i12:146-523(-)
MQMLQTKSGVNMLKTQLSPPSRVIKVSSMIEQEKAKFMPAQELEDMLDDLMSEFVKYGSIVDAFIVKGDKSTVGAEAGCVFIMFGEKEQAEKAHKEMNGKKFDKKDLKLVFINEDTFNKHFVFLR